MVGHENVSVLFFMTNSADADQFLPRDCSYRLHKGKAKGKFIYIALIFVVHASRSGIYHTVLPTVTAVPTFTS